MSEARKCMYCPFMKELCINGHTKSMGEDEKTGEQPKCRFWIGLQGKHPQSGKPIDEFDCSFAWQPTLMVEQARVQNSTAGSIESMRNRMVEAKDALLGLANQPPPIPKAIDTEAIQPPGIEHKKKGKKKKKDK